jgi:hypothetical protein
MMHKTAYVFGTIVLIIASIGMWEKFASITIEPVTATPFEPSGAAISPFELMLKNGKAIPNAHHVDYTYVYLN